MLKYLSVKHRIFKKLKVFWFKKFVKFVFYLNAKNEVLLCFLGKNTFEINVVVFVEGYITVWIKQGEQVQVKHQKKIRRCWCQKSIQIPKACICQIHFPKNQHLNTLALWLRNDFVQEIKKTKFVFFEIR